MEEKKVTSDVIKQFKLPPTPYILTEIQKELNKDDFSLSAVANLIAQDAGLAALMLRSVNSPFFGLRQEVTSIHHAINLLGVKNTVNIVSGLLMRQNMGSDDQPLPPKFWDSPNNIALVLAALTKKLTTYPTDEAYMIGLFHNVGHVLLMSRFDDYGDFLEANFNPDNGDLISLEKQQYGMDHATLSYALTKVWGLTDSACNVIFHHHNVLAVFNEALLDDEKELTLLCLLKMAENIDKRFWGITDDTEWAQIEDTVIDYMGISDLDYGEIAGDMAEKLISG